MCLSSNFTYYVKFGSKSFFKSFLIKVLNPRCREDYLGWQDSLGAKGQAEW